MAYKVKDVLNTEMLNELIKSDNPQEAMFGKEGLLREMIKNTLEAALDAELSHHLSQERQEIEDDALSALPKNKRNGKSEKKIKSGSGSINLEIPRDRTGSFEPKIVPKHQRRLAGLDEKILAFYARGMSVRDIQSELEEIYGIELSTTLISQVTDRVVDEVKAWQNRPLDAVYPIVYLDAIVVKVKENRQVQKKAVYIALGINLEGKKEVLGLWVSPNEGAKFWLSVLTEVQNRGVKDIFIVCTDGLTGFPEAIEAVYPQSKIQLCIVHMVRNSVKYVSYKDRKALCGDLKNIYQSSTADEAETALIEFGEKWDSQYPSISAMWQRHWEHIVTFFDYPEEIRRVIYTTNAIESLNMTIRKFIKNKRSFPSDDAMFKQIYLALNNIAKRWTMPIRNWGQAMNRFIIEFGDRMS